MADTFSDGGNADDDGAIVIDVCGGKPAMLAAAMDGAQPVFEWID